ncbi:MAG: 30S ribosomal protein S18 [Oligoflexia bacterium]|nr:30S ribosomal protein S18 [Oligoflexia bacterium]
MSINDGYNNNERGQDHEDNHGSLSSGDRDFDLEQDDDLLDDENGGRSDYRRQYDMDKDRKMFSRKKTCWFCAKKSEPDWKEPHSYTWLVNEFGKISPARVSGLCAKHQRRANTAIKRGRNMCLIGYVSNRPAQ